MKLYKNYIVPIVLIFIAPILLNSCIKGDVDDLGSEGNQLVGLIEAPEQVQYFSPFDTKQTIHLANIIRYETNAGAMNQTYTMTLENNLDSLEAYNEANETDFLPLPEDVYTLVSGQGIEQTGTNTYQVTFAPGVSIVSFSVTVDGSKWDLLKKYGVYLVISDPKGKIVQGGKGEMFSAIAIKNKWDGIYEVTGTMEETTGGGFVHANEWLEANGYGKLKYELRTTGPNTCVAFDPLVFGDIITPMSTDGGAGISGWGSFGLVFEFDPVTDDVVSITNYYGVPTNTRTAGLDPTGENKYDPATKTITVKYFMYQPSVVLAAPHIRCKWDESWKFVSAR